MIVLLLIGFGMILGSFVNALVWRLHAQDEVSDKLEALAVKGGKTKAKAAKLQAELKSLSISKGRSMCSECGHPLVPKDLVPLLSWALLGGKCRYCRKPIADPPIIELIVPALFVISYFAWPEPLSGYGLVSFGLWLVFLTGFTALSLYDIRWYLLPDRIVWPLVAIALLQVILHATVFDGGWPVLVTAGWGIALASGVFLTLYLVAERLGREWIGFGDVKLGLVLGLLVGGPMPAILVLYLASLFGLLASLPGLVRHRMTRTSLIPFGPFLMAACVTVVLFGNSFINWLDALLVLQ